MAKTIIHLPTELIELILFQVSDRNSLLSFAYSSQTVYQVYLMSKKKLHLGFLDKKYDEISLDIHEAIAAIRSTGLGMKKHKEEAIAVLDIWRRRQETASRVRQSLSMEEIIQLDKFHREMLFLLEDSQHNGYNPSWIRPYHQHLPIQWSNSERRRFVTGLCRLVIYANIFEKNVEAKGFVPSADDNNWKEVISAEDAWRLFFGTMPPWECDEMGGVWYYLLYRWDEVLDEQETEEIDIISDWERCSSSNYPEESVYRDSLRNVGGTPFRQLTLEEELDSGSPRGATMAGNTILRFHRAVSDPLHFVCFGPRFLFRVMHADVLVRHKTLLVNINIRQRFRPWTIGLEAQIPRNHRLPLLYPAEKYNVGSFDELWLQTSDTDGPASFWRCLTQDLFAEHQDFDAAFVKQHIANDPDAHNPTIGWSWRADIWDEEKLERFTTYRDDWYDQLWAEYFP